MTTYRTCRDWRQMVPHLRQRCRVAAEPSRIPGRGLSAGRRHLRGSRQPCGLPGSDLVPDTRVRSRGP